MFMSELKGNGKKYGCVCCSFLTGLIEKGLLEYDAEYINSILDIAISKGIISTDFRVNSYERLAFEFGIEISDQGSRLVDDLSSLDCVDNEFCLVYAPGHCELYLGDGKVFDPGYQHDTNIDEDLSLYHEKNGEKVYSQHEGVNRRLKSYRKIQCRM